MPSDPSGPPEPALLSRLHPLQYSQAMNRSMGTRTHFEGQREFVLKAFERTEDSTFSMPPGFLSLLYEGCQILARH